MHLSVQLAWIKFLLELDSIEPEVVKCCVPDCVYRGHCFEYKSCGWHKSQDFINARKDYMEGINE